MSEIELELQTIIVRTTTGRLPVEAVVLNDVIAIHPEFPLEFDESWTVTHIPTGRQFQSFNHDHIALLVAEWLIGLPVDWRAVQVRLSDKGKWQAVGVPPELQKRIFEVMTTLYDCGNRRIAKDLLAKKGKV
ncbi:MAG: hypothetical protein V1784_09670 [bacterium]